MESLGKLKFIGESFYDGDGLTDGKIYDVVAINEPGLFAVVDDSGEDYLYSMTNPAPGDWSSEGGKWELVEDYKGILSKYVY
ncbi:hypothetical protein [Ignavigranum ruoffiae]|uniref:hypothetical protein n=1 Tax=Ignavigranum ruoffiae TaxID=89093 RepID=UPI0024AD1F39|nr:hypothetical protein [Ignavigranum ruoffiae]